MSVRCTVGSTTGTTGTGSGKAPAGPTTTTGPVSTTGTKGTTGTKTATGTKTPAPPGAGGIIKIPTALDEEADEDEEGEDEENDYEDISELDDAELEKLNRKLNRNESDELD